MRRVSGKRFGYAARDVLLVGWSPGFRSLRRLLPSEQERALTEMLQQMVATMRASASSLPVTPAPKS